MPVRRRELELGEPGQEPVRELRALPPADGVRGHVGGEELAQIGEPGPLGRAQAALDVVVVGGGQPTAGAG